jgi:hypothetical protein
MSKNSSHTGNSAIIHLTSSLSSKPSVGGLALRHPSPMLDVLMSLTVCGEDDHLQDIQETLCNAGEPGDERDCDPALVFRRIVSTLLSPDYPKLHQCCLASPAAIGECHCPARRPCTAGLALAAQVGGSDRSISDPDGRARREIVDSSTPQKAMSACCHRRRHRRIGHRMC